MAATIRGWPLIGRPLRAVRAASPAATAPRELLPHCCRRAEHGGLRRWRSSTSSSPVRTDLEAVRRCVESVLASSCATRYELILVNDATPEPDLARYLREVRDRARATLLDQPAPGLRGGGEPRVRPAWRPRRRGAARGCRGGQRLARSPRPSCRRVRRGCRGHLHQQRGHGHVSAAERSQCAAGLPDGGHAGCAVRARESRRDCCGAGDHRPLSLFPA